MTTDKVTVHLILHAHIDPVWLWPWQAGLDETIATCRSACDRLDENPDAIFTLGDAWGYRMIERADPRLFKRMAALVAVGRWEIVGGWWLQPDCNLPSGFGIEKQIELGKRYFMDRFGLFPRIAFNVDSFGHAASLPGIMRRYGQDRYVMMRPSEAEMALPSRLFSWRGFDSDDPITCFRVGGRYWTKDVTAEHILSAVGNLPKGASHTMCFIGLGDHGGGPTQRQLDWCQSHQEGVEGCRLIFSSPSRFFDAVEQQQLSLPNVTGELQHHAVGCYSVTRSIKTGVRRAEHLLLQAQCVANSWGIDGDSVKDRFVESWEKVCFAHFHDALGGTCLPSAYPQLEDGTAYARATADDVIQVGLRSRLADLGPDRRQRIAVLNASDAFYRSYATVSPWTEADWGDKWRIIAPDGMEVPYQIVSAEASVPQSYLGPTVVFRVSLAPLELQVFHIERDASINSNGAHTMTEVLGSSEELRSGETSVQLSNGPTIFLGTAPPLRPRVVLYSDPTDTWGHGVSRIGSRIEGVAVWKAPELVDVGPLFASAIRHGSVGASLVTAEWRVYAGEQGVELLLTVDWRAHRQALKLVIPLRGLLAHTDGIPGSRLRRNAEEVERPVRDYTILHLGDGSDLGVVCPDVFSLEASSSELAFTLLRSPVLAHHDPASPGASPRSIVADQGMHRFRFHFATGAAAQATSLEERAYAYHRPLVTADWTYGMTSRSDH